MNLIKSALQESSFIIFHAEIRYLTYPGSTTENVYFKSICDTTYWIINALIYKHQI